MDDTLAIWSTLPGDSKGFEDMGSDERVRFAEQLAALRLRAGLSLAGVSTAAHVARGYVHHLEHGRRWPSQRVAEALDTALSADGALLAAWQAADRTEGPPADRATASSPWHPEDAQAALVSAAEESARLLTWAEASNLGDLTVEQMHSEMRWITTHYLRMPTLPLFTRARAIRDHAFALLAGRQRPAQSRDLYATAGWALTMLAWISTDLDRPDAAATHARTAWVCASNADHQGLRAWIRATQHTAAFWQHRFQDAAHYTEHGLCYATTGSAEAFLAGAHALDLAKVGHAEDARRALARARDAAEAGQQADDELAGPFTCSADRAGGIWSDVLLALGEPAAALAEADRAVATFERTPTERRNPGSERMARVQQVRAHLALGQFDGAAEALLPVLTTAAEHRVRPLLQRITEVYEQTLTCGQPDEPALCAMREAITDFRQHAVLTGLST